MFATTQTASELWLSKPHIVAFNYVIDLLTLIYCPRVRKDNSLVNS